MTREWTRSEDVDHGASVGAPQGVPGKSTRSGKIQRRAAGGAEPAASLAGMGGGGGAALPEGVRGQFEGSLGADLNGVRVHTGGDSAAAAESLNAQAFTVGNDIHFGAGRFQPDDPFGLHLLAHEVAHTQQQAGGTQLKSLDVSQPGDALEVEADRAADAMVRGAPAAVSGAGPSVQRVADDDVKPKFLDSYLLGRAFPWELFPEPRRLTAKIIQDWIDFYGLSVYGMPNLDDPGACTFNGGMTTLNAVVSLFMREAKLARFNSDPYGAYEIISRDQKAKYAANEKKWKQDTSGGASGPTLPHKPSDEHEPEKAHGTHLELEWEFVPITPKVTWGGHAEVEGPKHEFKGVFNSKVKEVGAWKAELSGAVVVELESGKAPKIGTEVEGKLSREFLVKQIELELVGKISAETASKLESGTLKGHLMSDPVHIKPSAELNLVYTIPGLQNMVEVKGGVSADPEGISLGASFGVKWK